MKQDKIRISIDEILRIIICIFHIAFLIEIILIVFFFYEFATNRNLACAELMRKANQLGRP